MSRAPVADKLDRGERRGDPFGGRLITFEKRAGEMQVATERAALAYRPEVNTSVWRLIYVCSQGHLREARIPVLEQTLLLSSARQPAEGAAR